MDMETSNSSSTIKKNMLSTWAEIINTCNSSVELEKLGPFSKFLLVVRACVLQLTINAGLIGLFLAISTHGLKRINWVDFLIAFVGIILAHMSNNMINDFFDMVQKVDEPEYIRPMYAPHPVISGVISKKTFIFLIFLVNLLDLGIGIYFFLKYGWLIVLFAGLGFFISFFYVAPPLKLKHIGLGELGVMIVWGPLMIGGIYYVTVGEIDSFALIASIPYGLIVGAMLFGKHIDKMEFDKEKGIHTLPVLLGEKNARRAVQFLLILFVIITLGIGIYYKQIWLLLILFSLKRLWFVLKVFNSPKPEEPPEGFPIWPLWFVSYVFYYIKLAGTLFFLGLLLNALIPIKF